MQKYVVRNIERPSKELIDQFAEHDSTTVYEAQGKIGLMAPYMKPLIAGRRVCGPAVTVVCPAGDNLMIHVAIEVCQPGDVLVITTIGESVHGMIGELIVTALERRGVAGVVIDAGIRDIAQIRKMGFPIWSKAVYGLGTTKSRGGWVNAPAVCAGTEVHPGDIILADDDGVVVVRKSDAEFALNATRKRVEDEEKTKARIVRGELSLDFYSLREVLQRQNVVYYDNIGEIEASK
ncbi:4-carboxy-4-hydroxy-2-oxoadipate aldolase/oxaloacetate decarboxylase [Cohnella laeviribosi]|uniref:4-carboxy-4-hydroxy-2-oxoadipate aldolase/oxaloacetate decarboxylase n=1 Tax=Cohnella laeviribosi TaxID=380174 RepID=UPI00037A1E32|nr:4-carboxy-4-hydroxy-2-oxoadipate aldolase/oxaloacetate decarboxylase [Cohnella laeviribosi]